MILSPKKSEKNKIVRSLERRAMRFIVFALTKSWPQSSRERFLSIPISQIILCHLFFLKRNIVWRNTKRSLNKVWYCFFPLTSCWVVKVSFFADVIVRADVPKFKTEHVVFLHTFHYNHYYYFFKKNIHIYSSICFQILEHCTKHAIFDMISLGMFNS